MATMRYIGRRSLLAIILAASTCCLLAMAAFGPAGAVVGTVAAQSGGNGAGPRVVLIIRHAEKSGDVLDERGVQRARRLADMFVASARRPVPFPTPNFIFASGNTPATQRCADTVTPLAARLRLPVRSEYLDNARGLARELRQNPAYAGKTVLICWRHAAIPELARALGADAAPSEWHKSTFDRVWQIRYDQADRIQFSDLPQRVLAGDAQR